jgi:hypothetical protein
MFKTCPEIIVKQRRSKCRCSCSIDFFNPCASCPNGNWGPVLCDNLQTPLKLEGLPTVQAMAESIVDSVKEWAQKGFKITNPQTLQKRLETCYACEHWNPKGFNRTGRCMKCGCSTWAKLRMATEKCPIGKW